jgi:23S rRNA (cytidine1920-2'-O)/16S rRNA (cytidine1409-2'-O)-methyltransferase
VGRGGEKLDAAVDRFGVTVDRRRALDAGASTGGFTDCLLQRGASSVAAVDVGHGQLHERLRQHPRVAVEERTNIRDVTVERLGGEVDVSVADLSFISLTVVAPVLVGLTRAGGDLVVLVKPQFEAGRREASRGRGVIRSPEVWSRALESVIDAFESSGATIMGLMVSPLRGASGNVEFLLHARRGTVDATDGIDTGAAVAAVVAEATPAGES